MSARYPRRGMTLIEIVISLSLITVIAGLTGGIMRWYVLNQTRADHTFEELRMARAVLSMISDDLRCVLRNETLDVQPLVTLLQLSSGGGGGGGGASAGSAGGGASTSGGQSGASSAGSATGAGGASGPPSSASSASSSSSSGSLGSAMGSSSGTSSGDTTTASLPPGIYATATSLEVDISRVPRVDEAIVQPLNVMSGTLNDLPTDIKTVTYYVQGQVLNGVQDSLSSLSSDVLTSGSSNVSNAGLVRRIIARDVLQRAYNSGYTDQITRTGSLISKDVVGLQFEFYDGTQWYTTWDSSSQGLPRVIRVTIAMQNPFTPMEKRMMAPLNMTSMSALNLKDSGITVYSTIVTIPASALVSGPSSGTDSASSAMGLQ